MIAIVGTAKCGLVRGASAVWRRIEAPEDQRHAHDHQRHHKEQVDLRREPRLRDQRRNDARREKPETPERMRPVHDATADHVLGAVGLEVQNDLDAADDDPHRKQQQEKRQRPAGKARDRIEQRQERDHRQDRAAIADALEDRPEEA
jgi:hypothetical protein